MTLNRKARAQSLNVLTFEGDRELGTGRAMTARLRPGCVAAVVHRRPERLRQSGRVLQRTEMTESGQDLGARVRQPPGIALQESPSDGVGLGSAGQPHRTPDPLETTE